MTISKFISTTLSAALVLSVVTGSMALAEERSVDELVKEVWKINPKELMIKQGLVAAPISMDRLQQYDEQGYALAETPTGAVLSSAGTELMCVINGHFTVGDVRFGESDDTMLVDFKMDERNSEMLCTRFTDNPAKTQCTVNKDGQRVIFEGDVSEFHSRCVEQMEMVLGGLNGLSKEKLAAID